MPRPLSPPSYRRRIIRGRAVAYVRLRDVSTKRSRDVWLGPFGSESSRERYLRVVAEWEAAGRTLPNPPPVRPTGPTISELILDWWPTATRGYSRGQVSDCRQALRLLRRHYGTTPAAAFGPRQLELLRDVMIRGEPGDQAGQWRRRPWSRKTIRDRVAIIQNLFRWAAAKERVPAACYAALKTIEPLRARRSEAAEPLQVRPVPDELLDATRPLCPPIVRDLIELQLRTGMRPGEACSMQAGELTAEGPIWIYRPATHKNAWRGHHREVIIGPRGQAVLETRIRGMRSDAFIFEGADGRPYRVDSYRQAVARACDRAFPPPDGLDEPARRAWVRAHRWHPHQLRHNAATAYRKAAGVEVARVVLGHRRIPTTELYAEQDRAAAARIARRIG